MRLFAITFEARELGLEALHAQMGPVRVAELTARVASSLRLPESALLATCLRVEIYGVAPSPESIHAELNARFPGGRLLRDDAAVAHLCRVTAGLESLVWGETPVTGQVRRAYREAVDRATCGPTLHRLFHTALRTARRLRSTGTLRSPWGSIGALAVRYAAAELASRPARALVLGAGSLGRGVARELVSRGWEVALGGSREREIELLAPELGVRPVATRDWTRALTAVDVVFSCSDRGPILDASHFPPGAGRVVVDLGMPPNLPPEVAAPGGVRRVGIEELARWAGEPFARAEDAGPWDIAIARAVEEFRSGAARLGAAGLTRSAGGSARAGIVHLVGAGPGDPELLTVRAARLIEAADIVFHDALVPEAILATIPRGIRRVPIGRRAGRVVCPPDLAHRGMIAWARRGAVVVRLKSGDPAIFASTTEEIAALRAAGVEYAIVPGITSATAAAAALGVPLTARSSAASCAFVTLATSEDATDAAEATRRLEALAAGAGSLAVYMAVARLGELGRLLLRAGRAPEEKIAISARVGQAGAQVTFSTVGELVDPGSLPSIETPAVVLVGPTVPDSLEYFSRLTHDLAPEGDKSVAMETPASLDSRQEN